MEEHIAAKHGFGTRLLKGLRGFAYVILAIMVIAVFYSGSVQVQEGNSQISTITCANGNHFTFASLGINASNYSKYTTQLYQADNAKINYACGSNGNATYYLGYDTHTISPNPLWDSIEILGIGILIIEVVYRFLAYVGGAKK